MGNIIKNIRENLEELRNSQYVNHLFTSKLQRLDKELKKLDSDVSIHHPFYGADKNKSVVQINNNPQYEFKYIKGYWWTFDESRKFESSKEFAEYIHKNCR
jgi:hypothetical protein